jgi:hypothetical protein
VVFIPGSGAQRPLSDTIEVQANAERKQDHAPVCASRSTGRDPDPSGFQLKESSERPKGDVRCRWNPPAP